MTSTVLVRDVILGVQATLQDANPPFRRWPEIELIRYANFGRMALAKFLPTVSSRTDAVKLAPGTKQNLGRVLAANILPGDGSTAADTDGIAFMRAMRNMGSNGLTPGRAIRGPVDRYTKDAFAPNWASETGTEVLEIIFNKDLPLTFNVSPGPAASPAVWIQIEWMANLPVLPAGGDPGAEKYVELGAEASRVIGVPDQYAEDLHNYIVAMALLKGSKNTANAPKAQFHASLFIQSINAQAQAIGAQNPNLKALPFAAEAT
jgi:hypothetical protein